MLINLAVQKRWGILMGILSLLAIGVLAYAGDQKITQNKKKIDQTYDNQVQIVTTLKVISENLKNMEQNVQDAKKRAEKAVENNQKTQEKILNIYEQMYEMNKKNGANTGS